MVAAISDAQAVAVLRNEGGALSCVPLLAVALPAATPNAVRKLFQLNRVDTIAAIMHDVVVVPEGRTDHDWLKLLVRAVDLRQSWTAADESRFGSSEWCRPTMQRLRRRRRRCHACIHVSRSWSMATGLAWGTLKR
jgi:putative ATP-dependent endonuclease of the OLD family